MDQAFPTVCVSDLKLEGVRLHLFTLPKVYKVQSRMRLTIKLHSNTYTLNVDTDIHTQC